MVRRVHIVASARDWIGTRYRHQGRTRHGIDCAGLIIRIGHEHGLITYDTDGYQRRSTGEDIINHFEAGGMDRIPNPLAAEPGDVILTRDDIFPCHAAMVVDGGKIVHAYAKRRAVVIEDHTEEWRRKTVAAFRFRGLED